MKKILIIHHGQGVGGGLIALLGLIYELKEEYHVTVFSIFDGVAVDYIKKTGVDVLVSKSKFYKKIYSIFIHSEASHTNILELGIKFKALITYFFSKYFFSEKELREINKKFDIIYLNSIFLSDWAAASKKISKKVIIHVREPISKGFFKFRYSIIRNTIKRNCDKIVVITLDNSRRLNLEYKTTVIYDPVVIKNRSSSEVEPTLNGLKYLIYIGGEARIKGFEQLVKSLKYLNDDIRIFFLGSKINYSKSLIKSIIRLVIDPYYFIHRRLTKQLTASNKIIYVGLTDNVFEYYKKSLYLISPFNKPHASLPVLEALSIGLPVIVSDIEGADEIVNKEIGFFFNNNNPNSLAKTINEASNLSFEKYSQMKVNCTLAYEKMRKNEVNVKDVIKSMYE